MNVLDRIFEQKKRELEKVSIEERRDILRLAEAAEPVRGFRHALAQAPGLALIAEVKKASPSQGVIREDFDAIDVAEAYERAGAQCLSVLTDGPNFQGSLDNLVKARKATRLPCLRKDFILDAHQVCESRVHGADAILLIVTFLPQGLLHDLYEQATSLGMDVLAEVHSESEAELALDMGFDLIGVNNRDLATFQTDLSIGDSLLPMVSPYCVAVSESALQTRADLRRVHMAGAKAVLIGTTFCAAPNIEDKVREVMGW